MIKGDSLCHEKVGEKEPTSASKGRRVAPENMWGGHTEINNLAGRRNGVQVTPEGGYVEGNSSPGARNCQSTGGPEKGEGGVDRYFLKHLSLDKGHGHGVGIPPQEKHGEDGETGGRSIVCGGFLGRGERRNFVRR